ncbi:MAG: hypothetical protein Terrestrivirus2_152 [Terrestrivirus sp.]|jgi:thioredoxin-like negative regulator of GroEL|uniref:Thioredoxin domain-containing protein n=1 Tax=Terrestrivirus sp. TaxID=2487775 RepID=A0A3G4ZMK5_9VIRU|nr:MAG: hypothetical protein Terrestrivirus2_152 [Terrestrivirus sp.]
MTIVEIASGEELYFILTRYQKVVLYFYVPWRLQCTNFNKSYINESRKVSNNGIIFCRISVDEHPRIQNVYDVDVRKTPVVIYLNNTEIVKKFYGNKPEVLVDYTTDFSHAA